MKAIISNRIYIETDGKLEQSLKEELTYRIEGFDPDRPTIIQNFGKLRPGLMTLPVGRVDLIPSNYEIVDKRVLIPVEFPKFKFTLRESQQLIYDDIADNALINARVSWGKTFAGLAIAGKLGQKTLIVVHTLALMHQWAKEVKKVYGIDPGLIGDGHDDSSKIITIGNVQSLYTRMDQHTKTFGTIIMDEVHHAPSPTFAKIVDRSYARYKIGLSGTLERKDGKHVLLRDYFGYKVYKPPKENCMTPKIHVIDSGIRFPDSQEHGWATKITMLKESIIYQDLIHRITEKYMKAGHKVLVVSDRVEFLKTISKRTNTALIIGETKNRDAQFDRLGPEGDTDGICGILSIFKEGISHDPLSCVIMTTPINNEPMLDQLIGRIVRLCPDKQQPIVVDILLRGNTVEKQFRNRLALYLREGYEVEYV